jgi:hypothetical protein
MNASSAVYGNPEARNPKTCASLADHAAAPTGC